MTAVKIKKQNIRKVCHKKKTYIWKFVYLRKNEIDVDSLKKDHEEFIKNNKLILKEQQRFKSERHN